MKRVILVVALCGIAVACGENPAAPSAVTFPRNSGATSAWSPYLGLHAFNWEANIQQPHLVKLLDAGMVRGLRVDVNGPHIPSVVAWAQGHGVQDVLGIFGNEHLRSPNVVDHFDAVVAANPAITHWEIGNEVELFIQMDVAEYMPVFMALYEHAKVKHPELVLIPHAPVGGGSSVDIIDGMMDQGILKLANDPDINRRLQVVSIHIYSFESAFIYKVKRQLQRLPATTEVWITETGLNAADWSAHPEFVATWYPRLRDLLRASRIYWYVFSECTNFSMVKGLSPTCPEPIAYSPLFTELTGSSSP